VPCVRVELCSRAASIGAPTPHGILAFTEFTSLPDPAAALKGL